MPRCSLHSSSVFLSVNSEVHPEQKQGAWLIRHDTSHASFQPIRARPDRQAHQLDLIG